MTRLFTLAPLAVAVCVAVVAPAFAQGARTSEPVTQPAAAATAELHGVVADDRGQPVAGAVVSALGVSTVFAVSDREGRFTFKNLTPGAYLVRAHLQGYVPSHGRITQVLANARNVSRLSMARRDGAEAGEAGVLEAGVGPAGLDPTSVTGEHDHDGQVAWRLRHLKRSVLRDAAPGLTDLDDEDSAIEDSFAGVGRAVGDSARVATALFADLALSGQINLLTTTSFDRPQDLFAVDSLVPRGVAHVALTSPTTGGLWSMRGALRQGELPSWIVSGSFQRNTDAAHRYEAGLSYGMQSYLVGNVEALAAVTDGSRNAGSMYAFDEWKLNPHVTLGYGARYSRYDYLADRALFSPRISLTMRPSEDDPLRVRTLVTRREIAPGAEEFLPPSEGILLPPERTFSALTPHRGFAPERIEHVEIAAERESFGDVLIGMRAFRQHVDDQLITMFGVTIPGRAPSTVSHYYVASGGDFEARGWSVSVARQLVDAVRASLDYTQIDTRWVGLSPESGALTVVAASALRTGRERVHDVTASVESAVPATDTRVFVLYKVSTGFAGESRSDVGGQPGVRFDVQVNQELPFMNFTNAQWEMLVAVRNLYRDELLESSVYDELLVLHPPKRIVGGLTVRF